MTNQRAIQLNKKNEIKIISSRPGVDLDSELFAINWFDLKSPRLYEIYNQLAYPHLKKVGGKVHFKGIVKEKIKGPEEMDRTMLLIVSYPSANSFLSMLSSRIFLLKSVIRIRAVDYFTFGFVRRIGSFPQVAHEPSPYTGSLKYLLHQFQSKSDCAKLIYDFDGVSKSNSVKSHFMGYKAAIIGRTTEESKWKTQPFLMDGLILWEASQTTELTSHIESTEYQEIASETITNNYYVMHRLI